MATAAAAQKPKKTPSLHATFFGKGFVLQNYTSCCLVLWQNVFTPSIAANGAFLSKILKLVDQAQDA